MWQTFSTLRDALMHLVRLDVILDILPAALPACVAFQLLGEPRRVENTVILAVVNPSSGDPANLQGAIDLLVQALRDPLKVALELRQCRDFRK
jgi:hypothetical protein